jgi:predicted RNase H-like nuclease (RuvC/YqgF family)
MNKSVRGEVLEGVIWDDVHCFVTRPDVAIEQLRAQQEPLDATLGERVAEVETQLKELERRERNHLRVAAKSQHASIQALDEVLKEIKDSQRSLMSYREQLQHRLENSGALAHELFGVAERLTKLQVRINEANFEEKRRAVEVLVKNVCVDTQIIEGKPVAITTVTYRFDDPDSSSPALIEAPEMFVAEDSTLQQP